MHTHTSQRVVGTESVENAVWSNLTVMHFTDVASPVDALFVIGNVSLEASQVSFLVFVGFQGHEHCERVRPDRSLLQVRLVSLCGSSCRECGMSVRVSDRLGVGTVPH